MAMPGGSVGVSMDPEAASMNSEADSARAVMVRAVGDMERAVVARAVAVRTNVAAERVVYVEKAVMVRVREVEG